MKSFGHRKTLLRGLDLLRTLCPQAPYPKNKKKYKEEELFERLEGPYIRRVSQNTWNNEQTLSKDSQGHSFIVEGHESKQTLMNYQEEDDEEH